MYSNFNEFMDEFNVHTLASNSNPHKVANTSDTTKTVTTALQKELYKKSKPPKRFFVLTVVLLYAVALIIFIF